MSVVLHWSMTGERQARKSAALPLQYLLLRTNYNWTATFVLFGAWHTSWCLLTEEIAFKKIYNISFSIVLQANKKRIAFCELKVLLMIPNQRQREPVLTVEVTIKDFPQFLIIRDTCTGIFVALELDSFRES